MGILSWIVFGLVVGLLARALLPGRQNMGLIATTLLGVAGSFVGGFVASMITGQSYQTFNTAGVIGSVLGAIVLLVVAGFVTRRRVSHEAAVSSR